MSSAAYKNVGGYVCTAFVTERGPLRVSVEGAPKDARISLNGIFSTLASGHTAIDVSRLPDGSYPLFLHASGITVTLGMIEKTGGIVRRSITDEEIKNLECGYAELYERLSEAQKKILALEARVYESDLF